MPGDIPGVPISLMSLKIEPVSFNLIYTFKNILVLVL